MRCTNLYFEERHSHWTVIRRSIDQPTWAQSGAGKHQGIMLQDCLLLYVALGSIAHRSNSKSESESSPSFPLTFFCGGAFVLVLADRIRDDGSSSSRSSKSEPESSRPLSSSGGLRCCGIIAPAKMSTASSSAALSASWNPGPAVWTARTFDAPLAVGAPRYELVEHLAFAIDYEHG